MSHTKGPWRLMKLNGGKRGCGDQLAIFGARNAVVFAGLPRGPQQEADATLMTAAPEFLEAAKHFVDCEFDSQGRAVVRVDPSKIELLRAAIAKAEGKQ